MCWLSIVESHSSSECAWRGMKLISYLFSPPSFAQHFLAGLLRSSYVSHHYSANPPLTMFNFLRGIWSAVGKICNPVAHLSSMNDSAYITQSLNVFWKEKKSFELSGQIWECNLLLPTDFWNEGRPDKYGQQLLPWPGFDTWFYLYVFQTFFPHLILIWFMFLGF